MKIIFFALLAFLFGMSTTPISAQVSFTKGEIIKKSYASSTMVVPPVIGKSDDGFVILSSGLLSAKKIVQLNLDVEMNQLGEEITVKLPKGKTLRNIFNIDNQMIAVLWSGKNADPFELYSYDTNNSSLGSLLLSISVTEYPGREELAISILNDDFNDFLGFNIRPKLEYSNVFRKVVVTSRKLDRIIWSKIVTQPYSEGSSTMGDYTLSDLYFNDANSLVARFTRPFRKEEKEQTETNMYHFNGTTVKDAWFDDVIRSTINEEFRSLPMPYMNKNGKVEVYYLSCETADGSFDLIRGNYGGTELARYNLSSEIDNLKNVKRIGIYGFVMPVNSEFENGKFCFLISEQLKQIEMTNKNLRTSLKHYVVSFDLNETGVSNDFVIDAGFIEGIWGEIEGRIVLSNSLDVIINGEIVSTDQREVFDRFVQVTKRVQPGTTFHYLIDGELYSFHSEYATGNMTSQLVKWNFN